MTSRLLIPIAGSLLAILAAAQPAQYIVKDLGTLPGGVFSLPGVVNDSGIIAGVATTPNGAQHAVVWGRERIIDIAGPGLGGLNTAAFGINQSRQISVQAETSTPDPYGEDFCSFKFFGLPSPGNTCLAALWQNGVLTALPTLGGNNSFVGNINNMRQIVGFAETASNIDCSSRPEGLAPQVLGYEAAIWGPRSTDVRQLQHLSGDTVGIALWINDNGQAVGASGSCADTGFFGGLATGAHPVLWDSDGSVTPLRTDGGTGGLGLAINNKGQVVGAYNTSDTRFQAFLWTKKSGLLPLDTPQGFSSGASGINDNGDVIGELFEPDGSIRPVIWVNGSGAPLGLNDIVAGSPLLIVWPTDINSNGEIVGFGVHKATGETHAFRATPNKGAAASQSTEIPVQSVTGPILPPETLSNMLRGRFWIGTR